jgi:hypothetical protein
VTQAVTNLDLPSFEINIKEIGLSQKVFGNKNKKKTSGHYLKRNEEKVLKYKLAKIQYSGE